MLLHPPSDCCEFVEPHGPVLPFFPAPAADAYYGLLTNPVGTYGRASYGTGIAYTLRGDLEFVRKAENLFGSFGGESIRGELAYHYTTSLSLRSGAQSNSWFFCMPTHRVKTALRVYLYGQLCLSKHAHWVDTHDEEGDFVETSLMNEPELTHLASRLAESFCLHEILPDYGAIPDGENEAWVVPTEHVYEHHVVNSRSTSEE